MIAVFTKTQKDYDNLRCSPVNQFIRICSSYDIMGRKFTGVIMFLDWFNGADDIQDAYLHLMNIQPELFR
jgi:hypothetical protein